MIIIKLPKNPVATKEFLIQKHIKINNFKTNVTR